MKTVNSIYKVAVTVVLAVALCGCTHFGGPTRSRALKQVDLLIRNGLVYDGRGGIPELGDVAIADGRVVARGPSINDLVANKTVDAAGLAIAPGFINVLSHSEEALLYDGRGLSDVKQGVTLEILAEGRSFGPLSPETTTLLTKSQADIKYKVTWTTLGEFLEHLEARGISPNVASFVGAGTIRLHELGFANRAPTPAELATMQELVRSAMREGALGVGTALVNTPDRFAQIDELVALASASAEFGGGYISHLRSEGGRLLQAVDELIHIARSARVHAEIQHLKAAGRENWPKMHEAIELINRARADGVAVTANMYPYTAAATGLSATMPSWLQDGGIDAWLKRLEDPRVREQVIAAMRQPNDGTEDLYLQAVGSTDRVLLQGFKSERLKALGGKTLTAVAASLGKSPEDTVIDLLLQDRTDINAVYFLMSEENVQLGLSQPWVSIISDELAQAPEGLFLKRNNHPRGYGSWARFLGKYVREEQLATLPDAIRRLTRLPAENWKLRDRGCLEMDCHADIVIFDAQKIADHATYANPRAFSTGVIHVFVNGVEVVRDGRHTGATPGRVVRGPGWTGWSKAAVRP
jgi:N-acyl-D-amino-acid deacylase